MPKNEHYQTVMNGLAKGLELERQESGKDIGLDVPNLLPIEMPPMAIRAILTIDGDIYEVVMRPSASSRGVYPDETHG